MHTHMKPGYIIGLVAVQVLYDQQMRFVWVGGCVEGVEWGAGLIVGMHSPDTTATLMAVCNNHSIFHHE